VKEPFRIVEHIFELSELIFADVHIARAGADVPRGED
jgi:hypothetical protein